MLVPRTKGKTEFTFLAEDLLAAANALKVDVLNFTHFGFVQNRLAKEEVKSILMAMMNPKVELTIRVVVWDIDFRFKREMIMLWESQRKSTSLGFR